MVIHHGQWLTGICAISFSRLTDPSHSHLRQGWSLCVLEGKSGPCCLLTHLMLLKAPLSQKHMVSKLVMITRELVHTWKLFHTHNCTHKDFSFSLLLPHSLWVTQIHRLAAACSQDHHSSHGAWCGDLGWALHSVWIGQRAYMLFAYSKHWTQSFTKQLSFQEVEEQHAKFINV